MDIKKLQALVVEALEDVKAQDIKVFDTSHLTSMFDRIAVASGTSNRQTKALASSVRDSVKAAGGHIISMEGEGTGEWVLVDLGDMVVHIMQPAIRAYYRLEELWGDKEVKFGAAKRSPSRRTASEEAEPAEKVTTKSATKVASKVGSKTATKSTRAARSTDAAQDKSALPKVARKTVARKVGAKTATASPASKTVRAKSTSSAASAAPARKSAAPKTSAPKTSASKASATKASAAKASPTKTAASKPAAAKKVVVRKTAAPKPVARKTTTRSTKAS